VIYYQNEISIKRGLITIFINRLGDSLIVFLMCFLILNSFEYRSIILQEDLLFIIFLFVIGCFTKSAQFPFIAWLPAAITAPTPISSLVHSSTLVTAGVYLLIRLNNIFYLESLITFSKILGLVTIRVGGVLALIESDIKKVVAFSTLRQLGLIVFVLRFGEYYLRFFQLITHAIFKSFLFILSGVSISLSYGSQDGRAIGLINSLNLIFRIFLGFACLNLSGFPVIMGFFSKDLIVESVFSFNIESIIICLFYLSCIVTVSYRVKIYFITSFLIKFGFSINYTFRIFRELKYIIFLFIFMASWGLILEELSVLDDLYSFEQDLKILDFIILFLGIIIFLVRKSLKNSFLFFNYIELLSLIKIY
jgi:NADH-ubiquinone oxidoreductase chain 5